MEKCFLYTRTTFGVFYMNKIAYKYNGKNITSNVIFFILIYFYIVIIITNQILKKELNNPEDNENHRCFI